MWTINHTSTNWVEDEKVLHDAEDLQEKSGLESKGDSEVEDDDDDHAQPFTGIAWDLEATAEVDSDDKDSGEVVDAPSSAAPMQHMCPFWILISGITTDLELWLRVFSRQKHPITIADLFNWLVEKR
jgi:hypothetical protein